MIRSTPPMQFKLHIAVFLAAIFLFPAFLSAGVPARIDVEKAEAIEDVTDSKGKSVTCLTFKGEVYAGKITKNGKFFKTTVRKVKNKIGKLKAKKRTATGKFKKKLGKKIKAQKALKARHIEACEGDDDGGEEENPEDLLKPLSRAVTDQDIRYLTEKAGFGFSKKELGLLSLKSQGIEAVVTEFMRIKDQPSGFQETYDNWLDGDLSVDESTSFSGIRRAWIYAMQNGNNPFRERFALWLFSLWTAAEDVLDSDEAYLLSDYINGNPDIPLAGIRGYANNPDMRDMAINMSRSAMMLIYLDGASNIKDNPNENFARELFELFTVSPEDLDGNSNYTEGGDIVKASAALTGWRVSNGQRGFSPLDQDTGTFVLFEGTGYDCTVSGSGQGKMDQVVNCIFDNHDNVAIYYSEELLKTYLTSDPSKGLITALASVIRDNNFNLEQAIHTLLSSEVFYADTYKNTIAKDSTEFALEVVRTLDIPIDTDDLEGWTRKMAMPLTTSPTVFWFPETTWTSAPVKLEAMNFLSTILEDSYSSDGWTPASVLPSGNATPAEVIAHVVSTFDVSLTSDQQTQLEYFLNNRRNSDGSYTPDPYDNQDTIHLRERGLGIYQILLMSIDFQMK